MNKIKRLKTFFSLVIKKVKIAWDESKLNVNNFSSNSTFKIPEGFNYYKISCVGGGGGGGSGRILEYTEADETGARDTSLSSNDSRILYLNNLDKKRLSRSKRRANKKAKSKSKTRRK